MLTVKTLKKQNKKTIALKRNLLRLRLWVLFLKSHPLRFSKTAEEILDPPSPKDTNESELDFLLVCPKCSEPREMFIPAKFYLRPSAREMAVLLAGTSLTTADSNNVDEAFDVRSVKGFCPGP